MSDASFSIVWQPYGATSPTRRSLSRPVSFPFFLDGSEHAALKARQPARLSARGLMLGILVAFDDPTPFADTAAPEQLKEALSDLVPILEAPSLEIAMLDASAYLREHHGPSTSRVALTTAAHVLPSSAMIRSDLVNTCWSVLKEGKEADHAAILRQIVASFREDDLSVIDPGAVAGVVFTYFVALCILGDREPAKEALIRSGVLTALRDPWYSPRIKYLLSESHPRLEQVI